MTAFRHYAGAFLVAGIAAFATTDHAQAPLSPVERNPINYLTGGIGETEVDAFKAQAGQYSLRMTCATKASFYFADVDVSIRTATGQRLLRVWTPGLFLFVRLPAGTYRIEVHLRSQGETRTVHVPARGGVEAIFQFDDPDECGVTKACGPRS